MITVQGFDDQNNIINQLRTRRAFIVASEKDRDALVAIQETVYLVSDDRGRSLGEWTPGKGVGVWDDLDDSSKLETTLFVVFPAHVVADAKAVAFRTALVGKITAYGPIVHVPTLLPGVTLASEIASGSSVDTIVDSWFNNQSQPTIGDTTADQVLNLAHDEFNFYMTADGIPFLVKKEGPKYAWLTTSGSDPNLRNYLTAAYVNRYRAGPTRNDVSDAISTIEARCSENRVKQKLSLGDAVSESGDSWIDLGREDGQVVRLSPNGWSVEAEPDKDVFFQRSSVVEELSVPMECHEADAKQTIEALLRPFVNATDVDWPLLVGWMAVHLVPDWVAPIALLFSEADAGKSTATMAIRHAVTGTLGKGAKMGAKEDDLAVTMSSSRVTLFNNVTKISSTQSDFLCQVVDGTEYNKRKLHTDAGVARLNINPSILMNGITTGELKGDFKTRSVKMELSSIYGKRMSDSAIKAQLVEQHPVVFGALLTVACQMLRLVPEVEIPIDPEPRMIDYARVLVALDKAWDLGGSPLKQYGISLDEMSFDALEDPFFKVLHQNVVTAENEDVERGIYRMEFTLSWLKDAFNSAQAWGVYRDSRGVFENTYEVAAQLSRLAPDWKRMGVVVVRGKQKKVHGKTSTFYIAEFTQDTEGNTPWALHTDPSMAEAVQPLAQ